MENIVKMIAAHTSNLLEFASVQSTLNDCIIKKIGSMQGHIKANTFLHYRLPHSYKKKVRGEQRGRFR